MNLSPGDVLAERFAIEALADTGGMSTVYRAADRATGERVAVKLLRSQLAADDKVLERFSREATVLASLTHPAIVRYVAHGSAPDGAQFLAMEWVEGETLARRVARRVLDVREALVLGSRLAGALAAAHELGVIHRDVKTSNVILVGGAVGEAKLIDFGVARAAGVELTTKGIAVGTATYMAPEQARGAVNLDGRADLYALGCVLFKALTGDVPFGGDDVLAVLARVLLEPAPRLRSRRADVPYALDELVDSLLAKEADRRPTGALDVARALAAIDATDTAGPSSVPPTARARLLGRSEQRLMTVVVARQLPGTRSARDETTLVQPWMQPLREAASQHGARVDFVADGSLLAVVSGTGPVTDLAARAARYALAIRRAVPLVPLAMATGFGADADGIAVGDVVDRATAALRTARADGGVRLDDVTAGLLDARFQVSGSGETGLELEREREQLQPARTLLGKPAPFVGREREIATLVGLYEECAAERVARAAIVLGPAGIGKSRLRFELEKKLAVAETPPQVWLGRGDATTSGSAFAMVRSSIRDSAGILEDEPAHVKRQKLRARVARTVSDGRDRVAAFLGELVGADFPDDGDTALGAARRDALVMGDQIRAAWQDFVRAETENQPLVVLLEDLHWGDLASVKLIDLALRNLRDRALFVVAFARPEVHDAFPALWEGRDAQHVRLAPLTPRASERLVVSVLGDAVERPRVERMVAVAEGNALALEELVRAAAAGRDDDVPATVLAMASARIAALDEDSRRVLRAASIFGQVFTEDAVAALLGGQRTTKQIGATLAALDDAEIVVAFGEGRFGQREYGFRHVLGAQAAYAMLTDRDRALGHKLAGEWLERSGEGDAMVIARHYELGLALDAAARFYLRASEEALKGNDNLAAIERAERVARCGAEGATLGNARRIQAWAHHWRGDVVAWRAAAEAALAALPERTEPWWDALGRAIAAAMRQGDRDASTAWLAVVEEGLREPRPCAALLESAARATISLLNAFGDQVTAARLIERTKALASESALGARTLGMLARAWSFGAWSKGDRLEFASLNEKAIGCFEAAGDVRQACTVRGDLGYAYIQLGAVERAAEALEATLREAERLGLVGVSATARHNLGYALLLLGRPNDAERCEREAIEAFGAAQDVRMEAASRAYLALALLRQGAVDEAEKEARRAVDLTEKGRPLRALVLATLAAVILEADPQESLAISREAAAVLEGADEVEGEAEVRLALAEASKACGDEEGAREAIRRARAALLERASKLPEGPHRDRFLERLPTHARTLALAAAWA